MTEYGLANEERPSDPAGDSIDVRLERAMRAADYSGDTTHQFQQLDPDDREPTVDVQAASLEDASPDADGGDELADQAAVAELSENVDALSDRESNAESELS